RVTCRAPSRFRQDAGSVLAARSHRKNARSKSRRSGTFIRVTPPPATSLKPSIPPRIPWTHREPPQFRRAGSLLPQPLANFAAEHVMRFAKEGRNWQVERAARQAVAAVGAEIALR